MTSYMYNPYSSTPPSLENVLKKITLSSNPPSIASIESLLPQLKKHSSEWNFDLALQLSSYIFGIFRHYAVPKDDDDDDFSVDDGEIDNEIPKGSIALLHLLTMVMHEWEDDVLYAVLVHPEEDGNKQRQQNVNGHCNNLIYLFICLVIQKQRQQQDVAQIALIGLSLTCQVLDRIQTLTTLDCSCTDVPWWITENDAMDLSSYILRIILNNNMSTDTMSGDATISSPDQKYVKLSALSILLTLFKHDMATSLINDISEDQVAILYRDLLVAAQILIDTAATPQHRYCVPTALTAASLLCMIKTKSSFDVGEYDRLIQSTDLIETIILFTFPSPDESSYRCAWALYDRSEWVYRFAIETFLCWNIAQNDEWSVFESLQTKWQYFVQDFWINILKNNCENDVEKKIPAIFALHTTSRIQARSIMVSSMNRLSGSRNDTLERPCGAILSALINMLDNASFSIRIHAARLIWSFLSDRRKICTHDELSRSFWNSLRDTMIDSFVKIALDHATTDDLQQALLLALLDILDSYLKFEDKVDFVFSKLGAEAVEGLIHVVDPKSIRVDYMDSFYEETQPFSETPPANNLSRLDEKSVCLEQEEVKEPRGIDNAVRLATATFLATLCYSSYEVADEGRILLSSRISTAVNDFLIDYQQMDDSLEGVCHSLNLNKRLFRLKLAMSTPENEDFVLTMEHTNKKLQQRRLYRLMEDNKRIQEHLSLSLQKEQQFENEKKNLKERFYSLSILSKREMVRKGKQATQKAQQLISIHAAERSKAESQILEALESAKRRESELQESQQREIDLDEKLRESMVRATEIENLNTKLHQQADAKDRKLDEFHGELHRKAEALEVAEEKCNDLIGQLHGKNEAISWADDANERLRENLEDLFADMSSLAQVYSFKENEEKSNKENFTRQIDEYQRKLKDERTKKDEITSELEKYKNENQKLYRKVEKYKQKIEEERQEREEEKQRRKRNGPVSYINQLHNSSNLSDKNTSRNQSMRTESSKYRSRDESSRYEEDKSTRYHGSSSQSRRRDESQRYEKENGSSRYKMASSQARKRLY